MELYQLRYFLAVADTGSFTKAAKRSFVSQPSLSQQILNLEEEFGQKLFHRLGRKAVPTESGKALADGARRILGEVEQTLNELRSDPLVGPKVAVGAIPTVATFFFPAVIAHCRANDLRIDLHIQEEFSGVLVEGLLDGKLDWALLSLPVADSRLEVEYLYREPLWLAISAAHRLASAPQVGFDDLAAENFILMGDSSTLTRRIHDLCSAHHFAPRIAHRCGQLATVKTLIALQAGISILPQSARGAADPEGLVFRRVKDPEAYREIALARHRRRHLSPGAALFAGAARAVVGPGERH